MEEQILFLIASAVLLTAVVTVAVQVGAVNAQANKTSSPGNMTTNKTAEKLPAGKMGGGNSTTSMTKNSTGSG
jgi:hypothetical protein